MITLGKHTNTDLVQVWSQSDFIFMKEIKNNKKQKKFEHKMVSPAKRPKCRSDFVACIWWVGVGAVDLVHAFI